MQAEALSRLVFAAMNSRDLSSLESQVTPDVVFDFPGSGRMEGSRRVLLFLRALLRKYPRLEFTVLETLCSDDRACVSWTNEGLDLEGRPYANQGVTLLHFRDGKISFISDYFKDTSFVSP